MAANFADAYVAYIINNDIRYKRELSENALESFSKPLYKKMKEVTPKTVSKLTEWFLKTIHDSQSQFVENTLSNFKQVIVNHLTEIMESSSGVKHSSHGLPIQQPNFKAIA